MSEVEIYSERSRTMSNKFFTYIARCSDGSLYTGITNNIKSREERNNQGVESKYTRGRLPLEIIYFETYKTRSEAAKREIQLKGWTRQKKENLIKGIHPNK